MAEMLMSGRFMSLIGHFVVTIIILWDVESVSRSCLDWDRPDILTFQMSFKKTEMTVAFSLMIAFVTIELLMLVMGFTIFHRLHTFTSFLLHSFACIILTSFVMNRIDCAIVWWIFTLCTLLPALVETAIVASILIFKRPI